MFLCSAPFLASSAWHAARAGGQAGGTARKHVRRSSTVEEKHTHTRSAALHIVNFHSCPAFLPSRPGPGMQVGPVDKWGKAVSAWGGVAQHRERNTVRHRASLHVHFHSSHLKACNDPSHLRWPASACPGGPLCWLRPRIPHGTEA